MNFWIPSVAGLVGFMLASNALGSASTKSARVWALVLTVASLGLCAIGILNDVANKAEGPGKVCVVQKRDIGGEWKCSEWRQP